MKYDYINKKIVDGSPGTKNLATRLNRVGILLRANRITVEDGKDFILRDFPTNERIEEAVEQEWRELWYLVKNKT